MQPRIHWHLFCKVIDNFGDIGVCWRLAKQLTTEHGLAVTLWVDDLSSFQALAPQLNPVLTEQWLQGVRVCHWAEPFVDYGQLAEAEVVIEAFACELPTAALEIMQRQRPVWLNLEYLSAESWVEELHGLPSPVHGLDKRFFFPGFSSRTGGLLWQTELLTLAQQMNTYSARAQLFTELGVWPELAQLALQISLFAYENPQLGGLLQALTHSPQAVHVLVPQGRISAELEQWLGEPLALGQTLIRGQLHISALPFMRQEQYDQLLASCQLNFVRGEESFVRAQMLGLPLLWHIYQQQDNAHLVKLEAFLAQYLAAAPAPLAQALESAFQAWNQPQLAAPDWLALLALLPSWQQHSLSWQQRQKKHGDLSANLVKYVQNKL